MNITSEMVLDALKNVDDPDLKKDIVTLGMVKHVVVDGHKVSFTVVLTTPACPMKDMIQRACVNAIKYYVNKEAEVKVNMTSVTSTPQKKGPVLPAVKNIIAVASGKGGVGKSTVAANLACALAMTGAKVGLVDADIYGPSAPIMFDVMNEKPQLQDKDGKTWMIPVESYGVKIMSMGFFTHNNEAVAWRGPIAVRALNQMLSEADWGELDYMIVDLPPGTGDIHLSLVAAIPVTGAIIVSTPQNVALADAKKCAAMFRMAAINVPIIGVVENMSWFTPAELPENKYYIFGREGGTRFAEDLGVPLLGQIPLVQSICESGDAGRPAVLQKDTIVAKAFLEFAGNAARQIAIRNSKPAEVVA
ncbi:MAG TPA: Mrp/NBP35 family ATP-binding protein [Bacteroidia bacterium]|jgi:ATP-binding protein involved in chromosome partitioning|nr:Mrp/NBP35 family ATP-binding protein [Bacteroidia bacterium]